MRNPFDFDKLTENMGKGFTTIACTQCRQILSIPNKWIGKITNNRFLCGECDYEGRYKEPFGEDK